MQFFPFFFPITQLYKDQVKKRHYRSLKHHYRLLKNVTIGLKKKFMEPYSGVLRSL